MKRVSLNSKKIIAQNKAFQRKAEALVKEKYEESKDNFLNNFESHPVTKELDGGNNAANISTTLNGIGNLFTFIGFYQNDTPIGKLRNAIKKQFSFKKSKTNTGVRFIITHPTLNKLKQETPMPWETGKSWVAGIEKGISGFGNYMYKRFVEGRSKKGLQAKDTIRQGSYKPTRYMSELIDSFIKQVKK